MNVPIKNNVSITRNRQRRDASPEDVARRDFRNVLLQELNLRASENPSIHLSDPVGDVPEDQLLEAPGLKRGETSAEAFRQLLTEEKPRVPEGQRVGEVPDIEVVDSVTLPLEGQDGVGAEPNAAIHPRGEMDSEERESRVRNLGVKRKERAR